MRLDFEGDREAVADIDGTRVLAGADEHVRPFGREATQQLLGVLVGAVLRPHQREHRELDFTGFAAEAGDDQVVLVVGQAQLAISRLRVGAHPIGTRTRSPTAA